MSSQSYLNLHCYPFIKKRTGTYLLPKEREQVLEERPNNSKIKGGFRHIGKRKAYPKEDTQGLPTLFEFIDISNNP